MDATEASGEAGITVLPVFPLGTVAYMPYSSHELNIFEPRYRQLYDDILVSGSRRFVVAALHPDGERLAEVGVVLYLTDLRDVSEETSDQVKYVCQHDVIGRVRIKQILNPASWEDGSTYLRAETMPLEDKEEEEEGLEVEEAAVMEMLVETAKLQKELDVAQIAPDVARHVNASRSRKGGLWSLVELWAEYYDYLVAERRGVLDEDLHRVYWTHMEETEGLELDWIEEEEELDWDGDDFEDEDEDEDEDNFADDVFMDDLPPKVQAEMKGLRNRFEEEMDSLLATQAEFVQLVLQSTSHRERLALLRGAFSAERRRLAALLAVRAAVSDCRGKEARPPE